MNSVVIANCPTVTKPPEMVMAVPVSASCPEPLMMRKLVGLPPETVVPSTIGLVFLGDHARPHLAVVARYLTALQTIPSALPASVECF